MIRFGILMFFFIGCIFICLTFYGIIFQSQILGILTPDWRAFEVSQMSHSDPLQHLPLTPINPNCTPEPSALITGHSVPDVHRGLHFNLEDSHLLFLKLISVVQR